jgi:hypothetical protein
MNNSKGCKTSRLFLNKLDDLQILISMGMYIKSQLTAR